MPVSISHHEGIYFPHLQQSTRGAGETGQLGSRTVRRGSDRIHYAFRRSDPEIHERSAEQQAHERQKNSGPAPELNHSGNPHPLPELQQNNSKLTISAFPPLLPELRTGPVGRGELSTGSGITISAPWLTEETRRDLEKKYDISVTPVRTGGKEIGYVFGQRPGDIGKIFLFCHGTGEDTVDFEKPVGVALKFVVAKNHDIYVNAHSLVENVAKGRVIYKKTDEQIYNSDSKKMIKNYDLDGFYEGHEYHYSTNCAKHVHELKNKGIPINLMVLSPCAHGVYLKDVIQGVNDTFRRMPELILGNCRGENEYAKIESSPYRFGAPGKKRNSEFMPGSEKRMAGDWTHETYKLNNPFWRMTHRKEFKQ
ncbi:hypothetical protein [Salmonella enterica]|uniref:hypothetical protein n=1 Tax=Salmonella enterica TaxID=28901 RepID=UPI0013B05F54|nr:hypothetical protein [Salmonella enterica]